MNVYIGFLLVVFVLGGFAPQAVKRHPWLLLLICIILALSFLSARVFS